MKNTFASERVPELDGIRGLAILLILAYHILPTGNALTNNPLLQGIGRLGGYGWIGVDIFFVISGYLITGILLHSRQSQHYYRNFYARRTLRIFPLYYLALAIIFALLPVLDVQAATSTRAYGWAFVFYQQNWLYLLPVAPSSYLIHTWSLAIEEQFYLVWPSAARHFSPVLFLWFSLFIVGLSLTLRVLLVLLHLDQLGFPTGIFFYFGSFTRFEGLSLGAALAIHFFLHPEVNSRSETLAWRILLLSAILFFLIASSEPNPVTNRWMQAIGYSLLAFFSASLIVLARTISELHPLRRFLRHPAITFLGIYSYGMYVLHLPLAFGISNWLQKFPPGNHLWFIYVILSMSATVFLALLSWHGLEKHFLRLKRYFDTPTPS